MKTIRRIAHIFNRARRDAELREEMQFHLAMKQRELEAAGFTPEQARDLSRRAVGNITVNREPAHAVWVPPDIESLWHDIPYAFRSLRRSPSSTIAAVGIYGILSYTVSRRRREIGIHVALGAEPATIRRMVVREGLTMALAGCAVGIVGAQLAARLLTKFMYDTRASDPSTLAIVIAAVVGVALIACAVPGFRAAAEDPTRALRAE